LLLASAAPSKMNFRLSPTDTEPPAVRDHGIAPVGVQHVEYELLACRVARLDLLALTKPAPAPGRRRRTRHRARPA
jgi:hypothetical protein